MFFPRLHECLSGRINANPVARTTLGDKTLFKKPNCVDIFQANRVLGGFRFSPDAHYWASQLALCTLHCRFLRLWRSLPFSTPTLGLRGSFRLRTRIPQGASRRSMWPQQGCDKGDETRGPSIAHELQTLHAPPEACTCHPGKQHRGRDGTCNTTQQFQLGSSSRPCSSMSFTAF